MSASALIMVSCLLQPPPLAQPPAAVPSKETKEVRGVVVEVFTDGLLLMSVGEEDYAEKGDQFLLARGEGSATRSGASAKIISLGKRYSVAKVNSSATGKTNVGDRVSLPAWEQRRGTIIIDFGDPR